MRNKVKFLVMDVDGTLTDGKIYMGDKGEMFKIFSVKDGCGIKDILPKCGIIPVIITARKSIITERRCQELNIYEIYQGVTDKRTKLEEIIRIYCEKNKDKISFANIAYMGDDILDLQCMIPVREAGGIVGCPADAAIEVKSIVNFISSKNGGDGAVREFIEFLMK